MRINVGYDWREILSGLEPCVDIVSVYKSYGFNPQIVVVI